MRQPSWADADEDEQIAPPPISDGVGAAAANSAARELKPPKAGEVLAFGPHDVCEQWLQEGVYVGDRVTLRLAQDKVRSYR